MTTYEERIEAAAICDHDYTSACIKKWAHETPAHKEGHRHKIRRVVWAFLAGDTAYVIDRDMEWPTDGVKYSVDNGASNHDDRSASFEGWLVPLQPKGDI